MGWYKIFVTEEVQFDRTQPKDGIGVVELVRSTFEAKSSVECHGGGY